MLTSQPRSESTGTPASRTSLLSAKRWAPLIPTRVQMQIVWWMRGFRTPRAITGLCGRGLGLSFATRRLDPWCLFSSTAGSPRFNAAAPHKGSISFPRELTQSGSTLTGCRRPRSAYPKAAGASAARFPVRRFLSCSSTMDHTGDNFDMFSETRVLFGHQLEHSA